MRLHPVPLVWTLEGSLILIALWAAWLEFDFFRDVLQRSKSVALLIVAVTVGTVADAARLHRPQTIGGYRVLAVDFHMHSSTWSDGALTPWGLVLEAQRHELDAIAITGHNQVSDARPARLTKFTGRAESVAGLAGLLAFGLAHR